MFLNLPNHNNNINLNRPKFYNNNWISWSKQIKINQKLVNLTKSFKINKIPKIIKKLSIKIPLKFK